MKPACIHDPEQRELALKFVICPLCLGERMGQCEADLAAARERLCVLQQENTELIEVNIFDHRRLLEAAADRDLWKKHAENWQEEVEELHRQMARESV